MLSFNFHCLILSLLNSCFFQDCSCQALNSLITFWPQQDGESPWLPEYQALGSYLSTCSPGNWSHWAAHTHFYHSHGEMNKQYLYYYFYIISLFIYIHYINEYTCISNDIPHHILKNLMADPGAHLSNSLPLHVLPPHGTSCIPTSHVDLLLFCLDWMSPHAAKDAL